MSKKYDHNLKRKFKAAKGFQEETENWNQTLKTLQDQPSASTAAEVWDDNDFVSQSSKSPSRAIGYLRRN